MRLSLDSPTIANQISHYENGQFTVNKRTYKQNLVICANKLLSPWTDKTLAELTPDDLTPALHCKPKILIIGTGDTFTPLPAEFIASIQTKGIGLEVMDTAAACRTYNVLVSEGREVAAALLI